MKYDVFIVDGNVFDQDAGYVELRGLSQNELSFIQRVVSRQRELDFVIRTLADDEVV